MPRIVFYPEERFAQRPLEDGREPIVVLDTLTGAGELLLDRVAIPMPEDVGGDRIARVTGSLGPPALDRPFRARVIPCRRLSLDEEGSLIPGSRRNGRTDVDPTTWRSDAASSALFVTEFPVTVSATGAQALELATDVLAYDELVMELRILRMTGAGPTITVELQTSMQKESTLGWVSAGVFCSMTAAPSSQYRVFGQLLRYIRWNVTGIVGTAAFFVSGVGRSWMRSSPWDTSSSS